MRRMILSNILMLIAFTTCSVSCTSAPGFELQSRSLLQGPARDFAFFKGGMIAAAGGAVYVVPDGIPPGNGFLLPLEGEPWSLAVSGSTVLAAVHGLGLVTIDFTEPTSPQIQVAFDLKDARSCAAGGRFLTVGGDRSGLHLFDISDPLSPIMIASRDNMAPGVLLSASGTLFAAAYTSIAILLTAGENGLEEVSRVEVAGTIKTVLIGNDVLHLVSSNGEVSRWRVSDPSSPELLAPLPEKNIVDIYFGPGGGLSMLGDGRIVPFPVTGGSSTKEAGYGDMSDPRYSMLHGEGMTRSPHFPGSSIRSSEEKLITFGPEDGFHFYDTGGKYALAEGMVPARGFALDLVVRDGYVFLANGRDGLRIGRIAENGSVEWTGHLKRDNARDVAIEGDILILAEGASGLSFYRLGAADSPVLLSTYESPLFFSAIMTRSGRAYLAGGLRGIEVVDFSDPADPVLVWRDNLSEARGLDLDDRFLYVADGYEGFRIYTLSGAVPKLLSRMDTPGWVSDVFVSGDVLYIADGQRGLMTADITDRASPRKLGRIETGAIARELHVRGKTVFIATQLSGITAVDVSNPMKPVIANRFQSVDDARGAFTDDRFVYLASGSGGLYIFTYEE